MNDARHKHEDCLVWDFVRWVYVHLLQTYSIAANLATENYHDVSTSGNLNIHYSLE